MSGSAISQDSKNPLLTGVTDEEEQDRIWELNQRWISPDQAQGVSQAYAVSNLAGVTNQAILQNDELAGRQDAMGGSDMNQQISKYSGVLGTTAGTAIGAAAGNPMAGAAAGSSVGSIVGDVPSTVTSVGSKNTNKDYMESPTLANAEKAAKWDYYNGNVDMDVYNALTGKGPSKYYRDEEQQKLLRKQVVLGASDRRVANFGGGVN
jgi:hypothetical protein